MNKQIIKTRNGEFECNACMKWSNFMTIIVTLAMFLTFLIAPSLYQ